jgi:hypothetical protein
MTGEFELQLNANFDQFDKVVIQVLFYMEVNKPDIFKTYHQAILGKLILTADISVYLI